MSPVESHPEELLDRARRAPLPPEEQRALDAHLESCAACRFQNLTQPGLFAHVPALSNDADVVAAALRRAEAELRGERAGSVSLSQFTSTPRRCGRRGVVVAALSLAAALAGATVASLQTRRTPTGSATSPRRDTSIASAAPSPAPSDQARPAVSSTTSSLAIASSRPLEPTLRTAVQGASSCAKSFSEGNRLRRGGDVARAAQIYRRLALDCPGSSEALTSHVLLGRISLDRLANPAAALTEFNEDLAHGHGSLREDALIGRALALGRLRRSAEERSAWEVLLREYPDSMYAEKAREKLSAPVRR